MLGLVVENISKAVTEKPILKSIQFQALPNEITAILGPSGCGKSTLLRIIAGIEKPDQGEIYWNNVRFTDYPPNHRGFGLMFQDYALFPHLNVEKNIAFGLQFQRNSKLAINARVEELLHLVNLDGYRRRDVNTLSGGEAQRVALARTLAPEPALLMLDEPMGSLDKTLRDRLITELKSILFKVRITTLYVTHDQEEAFAIANQVILLNEGAIVQTGTPEEIFKKPANRFVANFLGMRNIIAATGFGDMAETEIGNLPLPNPVHGRINILIRPEMMKVDQNGEYSLQGTIVEKIFLGTICRITVNIKGVLLSFDFPSQSCIPQPNSSILLCFEPNEAIQVLLD